MLFTLDLKVFLQFLENKYGQTISNCYNYFTFSTITREKNKSNDNAILMKEHSY